jgi:hypothetical protein
MDSLFGIAKHFPRSLFNNGRLIHIKRLTYNKRPTLVQEPGLRPTEIHVNAQTFPFLHNQLTLSIHNDIVAVGGITPI